ncbi:RICIN domain-containing protein, partial [Candidatus Saccharibacteria bacterium]|nr:RICIN domain-containing protein [Candidatus Saccharibacteria bacterium]
QILSTCSNKALDISGGNRASGANIQIYSSNKSKAQLWKFTAE